MRKIVFYQKSTGKVLTYQNYNEEIKEGENKGKLIKPELTKCSENHGISVNDIRVKEWTKDLSGIKDHDNLMAEYKKQINEINSDELEELI